MFWVKRIYLRSAGWPYCRAPPASTNVCPVTQPASSEAKNTAAVAMSCGCAIRPSGVVASVCLRKSLSAKPTECSPSVSTIPGLIEFTRIFFGPSSPASETEIASTAAFVALYTEAIGTGIGPTIGAHVDDRTTFRPDQLYSLLCRQQQTQHIQVELFMEMIRCNRL